MTNEKIERAIFIKEGIAKLERVRQRYITCVKNEMPLISPDARSKIEKIIGDEIDPEIEEYRKQFDAL